MEKIVCKDANGNLLINGGEYVIDTGEKYTYRGRGIKLSDYYYEALFTDVRDYPVRFVSKDGIFNVQLVTTPPEFKDINGQPLVIGDKYVDRLDQIWTYLGIETSSGNIAMFSDGRGNVARLPSTDGRFELQPVTIPPKFTGLPKDKKPEEDSIINEIRELLLKRSQTGISKYGVTLDRKDLKPSEWCQHLLEELLDASGYVLRLKKDLEQIEQLCNNNKG